MTNLEKALEFIVQAHAGQYRKDSNFPYVFHPIAVMQLLYNWGVRGEDTLIAALCHDLYEDTSVIYEDVYDKFGGSVADMVEDLTYDPRKTLLTKDQYIKTFSTKPYKVCLIKLADRICNVTDFYLAENVYARKYMGKAKDLPEFLTAAKTREDIQGGFNSVYANACHAWTELTHKLYDNDYWISKW